MKKVLLIIFLNIPIFIYSQNFETRKGKLFFKVGTEYRITPLPYDLGQIDPEIGVTNIDNQNAGLAVNYSLDFFVLKNLSLGFTNSFRYDVLLYKDDISFEDITRSEGSSKAENALMIDYHFYIDYHFKVFNNSELFVRVGKSLANRGTSYSKVDSFFDQDGTLVAKSISQNNFHFQPANYALGFKKNKVEIMAGVLTATNSEYFLTNERLTIPYLKLSYTIGKL